MGISVLFDAQMPFTLLLAKKIRAATGARIVIGGAKFGVASNPARILQVCLEKTANGTRYTAHAREVIDGIISGEGEIPLLHISSLTDWSGFYHTPNMSYWKNGEIINNPPSVPEDMDQLPTPDFTDFDLYRYLCPEPVLPLMTARGCPWRKCVFCTHHRSYLRYRQRPIERVIDDIKHLNNTHDVRLFNLLDEMIPPARFRKLAKKVIRAKLDIRYSAYGKPVKNFDEQTLKTIHDSGCRLILWGLESASQRILDLMKKGTKTEDVEKVIRTASGAGIKNLLFIMFGFPGETEDEFLRTISFLQRNKPHIHALSKGTFNLMEGSDVAKRPELYGLKITKQELIQPAMNMMFSYHTEHGLSNRQIRELFKKNLKRIESVGITPRFGTYREPLLIYACQTDTRTD